MLSRKPIIISIIYLYSIYSFGYASLDPALGYKVLLTLSFLALLTLFPSRQALISKKVGFIFLCFLGLSSLSVSFHPSQYADIDSLIRSLAMLLLSSTIVASFVNYDQRHNTLFTRGLVGCLLVLVLLVILYQFGIPVKKAFPGYAGFEADFSPWNQKYYAFWLVFLMWGIIAFHWRKNTRSTSLAIAIVILTGIAVFSGYSDSAKVAFTLSIIVFMVMHIKIGIWVRLWQSVIWFYILSLPFVWSLLPSSWLYFIKSINLHNADYRVDLYSFTAIMIRKHWFWGYGFGSASSVLTQFPIETGGHPHNVVLLFWLELGVLGAFLLAIAVSALLSFIHNTTRGRKHAPAVWALCGAGMVVFSFSFDFWRPAIVLLYGMWLAVITLSCQSTTNNSYSLTQNNLHELNSTSNGQRLDGIEKIF